MYIKGALDAGFNVHMKNTLDNKICFYPRIFFLVSSGGSARAE